ncbi:hypothetical protein AAEX63_01800 [Luteococcus sp. H138]|uniref:hypothetical protein n=1 Tax=Luteococcus sp. H138 TaxID=3139404 RepID=UPI00313D2C64
MSEVLLAHNNQNDSADLWGQLIMDKAAQAVNAEYGHGADFDDLVGSCVVKVWGDLQRKLQVGLDCDPWEDRAGALVYGMCERSAGAGRGNWQGSVNSHLQAQYNRTRRMLDDLVGAGLSEPSAWVAIDAHRVEHWQQNDTESVLEREVFERMSSTPVAYDPDIDDPVHGDVAAAVVDREVAMERAARVLDGLDPQGVHLWLLVVVDDLPLARAAERVGAGNQNR